MMNPSDSGRYDICPHCMAERPIRYREDTGEWVHTYVIGAGTSHTICQANELRKKDQLNG